MPIIDILRQDIEQAIATFSRRHPHLSAERQQNIVAIRSILALNNPVKIKSKLREYLQGIGTGFAAIFPFLEVNRFKQAIKQVLDLPKFEEVTILRSLLTDMGMPLNQDSFNLRPSDPTILLRLEKLESALELQSEEVANLQLQVKQLKSENEFLTKTIDVLTKRNQSLAQDHLKLKEDKVQLEHCFNVLQRDYENLLVENKTLKQQLESIVMPKSTTTQSSVAKKRPTNIEKQIKDESEIELSILSTNVEGHSTPLMVKA